MALYTLVILVRNLVESIRAVPEPVIRAADGMGYRPLRRFVGGRAAAGAAGPHRRPPPGHGQHRVADQRRRAASDGARSAGCSTTATNARSRSRSGRRSSPWSCSRWSSTSSSASSAASLTPWTACGRRGRRGSRADHPRRHRVADHRRELVGAATASPPPPRAPLVLVRRHGGGGGHRLPIGLAIGHTGKGRFVGANLAGLWRAIPTIGVVMLLFLWKPLSVWPVLVALVVLAIPPIVLNTAAGVDTVDRRRQRRGAWHGPDRPAGPLAGRDPQRACR